jgi:hypothetical protein
MTATVCRSSTPMADTSSDSHRNSFDLRILNGVDTYWAYRLSLLTLKAILRRTPSKTTWPC